MVRDWTCECLGMQERWIVSFRGDMSNTLYNADSSRY